MDFAPLLFDLSTVSGTTIRERSAHAETVVVLTFLKYAFSGSVEDVLRALKETGGSFDETFLFGVLNYAIRAFEVKDPVVVDAIPRRFGGEKMMPSIIDEWVEEGQRKTIGKLLAKGVLSVSAIASALEVDPRWVEQIRKELDDLFPPSESSCIWVAFGRSILYTSVDVLNSEKYTGPRLV